MSARSKARRRALDVLFEADQRGINAGELVVARTDPATAKDSAARFANPYTRDLVEGVVEHWPAIDEALTTYSQGWTIERMPAVDRAVLRMAVWEILWNTEVPDAVAISEAVDLVRELSTDESPAFVNGLLARISQMKDTLI